MKLLSLAFLAILVTTEGFAQDDADKKALQEVEKLLNDPAARQEAVKGNKDGQAVQNYFQKFPPYAQQELNAIVMMMMQESKADAQKHVDAYKGGAEAAYRSMSPQVKTRVQALERRLMSDPQFNTPKNLEMMKAFMPTFLGIPPK